MIAAAPSESLLRTIQQRAQRWLTRGRYVVRARHVDPQRPPRENFASADDHYWLWANTEGRERVGRLRAALPELPRPGLQRGSTGSTGAATLREAERFYRLVKAVADRHHQGGYEACRDIVDFGCGWGRMARFFLKDLDPDRLVGLDCVAAMVDAARATNRWSRFELIDPLPPTALATGSADLIYAYSVFSHLTEDTHLTWLQEFVRLLRPGGLLILTTRPRSFIKMLAPSPDGSDHQSRVEQRVRQAWSDTDAWLARYDAGEFCYSGFGSAGALSDSFYGEAAIPEPYARRVWDRWVDVLEYIRDRGQCEQDVIVARTRRQP